MDKQGREKIFVLTLLTLFILAAVVVATNPFAGKMECADGIDNDGDGAVDLDDGGCSSQADKDESNCGDGVCEKGENPKTCSADCSASNTCRDSDGGQNTLAQGTVTGTLNDEPYSSTDFCVDSASVLEFYCLGTDEASLQLTCGESFNKAFCADGNLHLLTATFRCEEGKCIRTDTTAVKEECQFGCTDGACNPAPGG